MRYSLIEQVLKTPNFNTKAKYAPVLDQFIAATSNGSNVKLVATVKSKNDSVPYTTNIMFEGIALSSRASESAKVPVMTKSDTKVYTEPISVNHECTTSCTCQDYYWNNKRYIDKLEESKKAGTKEDIPPYTCKHIVGFSMELIKSGVLASSNDASTPQLI